MEPAERQGTYPNGYCGSSPFLWRIFRVRHRQVEGARRVLRQRADAKDGGERGNHIVRRGHRHDARLERLSQAARAWRKENLIRALFVCWHSKLYLDKVTCLGGERYAFWGRQADVLLHMPWNTANGPSGVSIPCRRLRK